jgi:hypothetical protein
MTTPMSHRDVANRYAIRANSQDGDGVVLGNPGASGVGYSVILDENEGQRKHSVMLKRVAHCTSI